MRRLLDRWAPWVAGAVLVAGIAFFLVSHFSGGSSSSAAAAPKPVPLSPAARSVALRFVETAVARRDLAASYALISPTLRQNLSLRQWRTGTIPVTPYPVGLAVPHLQVRGSYPAHALLDVTFAPKPHTAAKQATFTLGLLRIGGRWLVDSWAPGKIVGAPPGT